MKNKKGFWERCKTPSVRFLPFLYLITLCFAVGSLLMLTVEWTAMPLAILVYVLFALAALTLAYSVYTVVRFSPTIKKAALEAIEKNRFTRQLKEDYGFRTMASAIVSFGISILYALFNGVQGVMARSVWYGALAAYYVLLTLLHGSVLCSGARGADGHAAALRGERTYRNCGIWLLVLQLALSAATAQMIFDEQYFTTGAEWMIYASAAYAFYKIITAILHFVRVSRAREPRIAAVRSINLVDASVSVLALQTTLLAAFGSAEMCISDFNTATGCVVTAVNLTMGIWMIVKGSKEIKKLKTEKENG